MNEEIQIQIIELMMLVTIESSPELRHLLMLQKKLESSMRFISI